MSGGVGPSGDTILPKEPPPPQLEPKNPQIPPRRRGLAFRHLNALATVIVIAASGMVSMEDLAFVVFSVMYMYYLSHVAFPTLSPYMEPPVFGQNNKILVLYVSFAAVIGLFLPVAYIFEGIYQGDKEGIKAAAPHLFLLASQVFMEGLAFSGRFALPIRVYVPVFYNSKRIFTIVDWLRAEFSKVDEEKYSGSTRRLYVGRSLAIANMALWCFNLFGFLLPVYLPKAFKIYYSGSGYKVEDKKMN